MAALMKFLYYLPPFIMNIMSGLLFFVPARRLALAGESAVAVAGALSAWAFSYALTGVILGFIQNRKNAVCLIFGSQGILISAFLLLLFKSEIHLQYYWVLMTGVGCVMFYGPYQMIVKVLEKPLPGLPAIVKSSAIYTFSWSSGLAAGPFVAAGVWGCFDPVHGWKACYGICIALSIAVMGIVLLIRQYVKKVEKIEEEKSKDAAPSNVEETPIAEEENKYPNMIWTAWAVSFCGYLTVSAFRALLPFRGECIGLTTAQQGVLLAVVSCVQAFTALAFMKSRTWMYKPYWMTFAGLLGIIGMLVLSFTSNFPLLFAGMVLYGIYCGTFAWSLIYHALADRKKSSLYVGINEALIGFGGIFAPLLGGLFSSPEKSSIPFLASIVLILLAILIQFAGSWRNRNL